MGRDVMLQTVEGERGRSGETCCFRQCSGNVVGGERHYVTDSARGKAPFWRDVMLQTVQRERCRCGETDVTYSERGKGVVRGRRDVTDSRRVKVIVRERLDVTDSARGKGVGRETRDVTDCKGKRGRSGVT